MVKTRSNSSNRSKSPSTSQKQRPKSPVRVSKRSVSKKPAVGDLTRRKPIVTNNVYDSFAEAVGNTPLIKLQSASKRTGCNIYAKAEYANPGGSVKDRAGLYLVADGEEQGILKPGKPGVIVEASAGNTAIGLTLAANCRGYRTIIFIPETQTAEKKNTIRAAGAHLIEVPAFPFSNPQNYVHIARRFSILLTKELSKHNIPVYYPNQWDNVANRRAHYETTGPEIIAQIESQGLHVDGFSCAMGTGGTLAGISSYLRSINPDTFIGLTDPKGALPYTHFTGKPSAQGSSISEGIGQSRITGNMEGFIPSHSWEIDDADALRELNILTYTEGLQVGLSSGINVAGAIQVANHLGPGHTIVTLLCDNAMRYASKMYNIPFLRSKNLPTPFYMDSSLQLRPPKDEADIIAAGLPDYDDQIQQLSSLTDIIPFDLSPLIKEAQTNHTF